MKSITWDNPNKMHFESDYKLFNKQTNVISRGNVIANTQYSAYIRPYSEIKNYGYVGKEGEFMKYDMKYFSNIPEFMKEALEDVNRKESYILYEFFVWKNKMKEVIGYVLADYNDNLLCWCVYHGDDRCNIQKRDSVIRECINYICN